MAGEHLVEQDILTVAASRTKSNISHYVRFLRTSDQPDEGTSAWHKKRSENTDVSFRGDSRSQQTTGRRPTPSDLATTGIGTIDCEAKVNNGGGRKIMYTSTGLRDTVFLVDENRHFHFTGPRVPRNPGWKTLLYRSLKIYIIRQHRVINHTFFFVFLQ